MQQIERYGVIALVFLLVTIVAISFWGDSKSPGFWSRLTGKNQKKEVVVVDPPALPQQIANPNLPLSPAPSPTEPQAVGSLGGDMIVNSIDAPASGSGTIEPPPPTGSIVTLPSPTTVVVPPTSYPPAPRMTTPAPVASSSREYVVKSGDSLARIARTQLGSESRWREIADLNPKAADPKSLSVGTKLILPSGAATMFATDEAAPTKSTVKQPVKPTTKSASSSTTAKSSAKPASSSRVCVVKKDDTLRSIARRELGDERRWREIASANPDVDPSKMRIGTRLKLPQGGAELIVSNASSSKGSSKPRVQ